MNFRRPQRSRDVALVLTGSVLTVLSGCGGDDSDSGGTAAGSGTIASSVNLKGVNIGWLQGLH